MSNRRDAETESSARSASNATFRPVLRTACFIAGVTALVVAIGGYASLTRSVDGAPVGSGGGIGAAIFVLLVAVLIGLVLVGFSVLLPGRGGTFTIPPARPTRGQRALVILGVGLVATVPLFPLAPGRISLALQRSGASAHCSWAWAG